MGWFSRLDLELKNFDLPTVYFLTSLQYVEHFDEPGSGWKYPWLSPTRHLTVLYSRGPPLQGWVALPVFGDPPFWWYVSIAIFFPPLISERLGNSKHPFSGATVLRERSLSEGIYCLEDHRMTCKCVHNFCWLVFAPNSWRNVSLPKWPPFMAYSHEWCPLTTHQLRFPLQVGDFTTAILWGIWYEIRIPVNQLFFFGNLISIS